MNAQMACLWAMFFIGAMSSGLLFGWDHMSRRMKFLVVAWLVFWLGPPLYVLWTNGVIG